MPMHADFRNRGEETMHIRHPSPARRSGTAAVELAVMMMFLVPLFLYGIWEVGRMIEVSQILDNAVREGARQASTGQLSDTQCMAVVREYLLNEGLPTANVNVTVTNLGFPGNPSPPDNNPQHAYDLDQLQITATIPYQDVQWVNIGLVSGPSTQLSSDSTWSSMKDRAYPVPVPPPGY
jgi:Flp pilus assembly protein TadG